MSEFENKMEETVETEPKFHSGDYVLHNLYGVLKVREALDNGTLITDAMENYSGRTYDVSQDEVELLDPDDAVATDYATDEPIFESSMDSTIEIYGFDRSGRVINLGIVLPRNVDRGDFVRCDECERTFDENSEYSNLYLHTDDYDHVYCEECYSDGYTTCEDCGEIVPVDTVLWDNDYPYCENCYYENGHSDDDDDGDNHMHDYSYKPSPHFHSADVNNNMFLGIELEIDKGGNVRSCLNDLYDISDSEDLFYCKHDGSLNDGIEIVTHPCDLKYHLNSFPWSDVINVAREHDFKSHDAKTCGLHVHVSREAFGRNEDLQDLNIAKAIILVDRFWEELVNFSRRDYNQLERWAKKPNARIYSYDTEKTAVNKMKRSSGHDRYKAINLCNSKTVEFRFFRGTLNENTLKATLEFVSNLVSYVNKAQLADVQDALWNDVAKYQEYPELFSYLKDRNLFDVQPRPRPEEPKPVEVRFKENDIVWFATESTDNEPQRGHVQSVEVEDSEGVIFDQPLYIVEDDNGYINFLIDSEIFSNDDIAQHERLLAESRTAVVAT